MRYVLDTTVLSDVGPVGKGLPPKFFTWLEERWSQCVISSVTLHEMAFGIEWLEMQGSQENRAKAKKLRAWRSIVVAAFDERVIAADDVQMVRAARIRAVAKKSFEIGLADSLIAASAIEVGGPVVTKNARHFTAAGVDVVNTHQFYDLGEVGTGVSGLRLVSINQQTLVTDERGRRPSCRSRQ